jgi:hypothetical protein
VSATAARDGAAHAFACVRARARASAACACGLRACARASAASARAREIGLTCGKAGRMAMTLAEEDILVCG